MAAHRAGIVAEGQFDEVIFIERERTGVVEVDYAIVVIVVVVDGDVNVNAHVAAAVTGGILSMPEKSGLLRSD